MGRIEGPDYRAALYEAVYGRALDDVLRDTPEARAVMAFKNRVKAGDFDEVRPDEELTRLSTTRCPVDDDTFWVLKEGLHLGLCLAEDRTVRAKIYAALALGALDGVDGCDDMATAMERRLSDCMRRQVGREGRREEFTRLVAAVRELHAAVNAYADMAIGRDDASKLVLASRAREYMCDFYHDDEERRNMSLLEACQAVVDAEYDCADGPVDFEFDDFEDDFGDGPCGEAADADLVGCDEDGLYDGQQELGE